MGDKRHLLRLARCSALLQSANLKLVRRGKEFTTRGELSGDTECGGSRRQNACSTNRKRI